MGVKLQRRSVYIGTVIVLIAAVAGFAVAAVSGIVITTTSGNQNYGTVNPGNTIYATGGSVSATLALAMSDSSATGTCLSTDAYTSATLSVVVAGAASACTATGEWYDVLTFTGVSVSAGASDTFYIAVNGGAAQTGIVISSPTTAYTPATLSLYIDDGPTTGAPLITSLSVVVAGT